MWENADFYRVSGPDCDNYITRAVKTDSGGQPTAIVITGSHRLATMTSVHCIALGRHRPAIIYSRVAITFRITSAIVHAQHTPGARSLNDPDQLCRSEPDHCWHGAHPLFTLLCGARNKRGNSELSCIIVPLHRLGDATETQRCLELDYFARSSTTKSPPSSGN